MTPSVLYKYVGPRGFAILESCSVRFTSPADLNDPFESRLPVITRLGRYTRARKRVVFPEEQGMLANTVGRFYGVTCFSEIPDNLLMWAHYAAAHSGAVIGFRTDHAAFTSLGSLLPVKYRLRRPALRLATPSQASLNLLLTTKSKEWAYEREWRVIGRREDDTVTNRSWLKPFDPECVHVVILGARANRRLKQQVLQWQAHHKTQVLQARLDSVRFGLFLDADLGLDPAVVVGDSRHVPVAYRLPVMSTIEVRDGTLVIRDRTSEIIPDAKLRRSARAQSRATGVHVVVHGEQPEPNKGFSADAKKRRG